MANQSYKTIYNQIVFTMDNNRKNINESFSSPKLAKCAKEHGGIAIVRNGGLRDGAKAWQFGRGIDVSSITDDMLVGEPFKYDSYDQDFMRHNNAVLFKDGYAIQVSVNADTKKPVSGERRRMRYGSGIGDTGDHDKSRGGFVGTGKDALSSPYNGFSVSDRAGESQRLRGAMEYSKAAGNERELNNVKNHARKLVKRINESQLREIIHNAVIEIMEDLSRQ